MTLPIIYNKTLIKLYHFIDHFLGSRCPLAREEVKHLSTATLTVDGKNVFIISEKVLLQKTGIVELERKNELQP